MYQDMDFFKNKTKENIKKLIETGRLEEAKELIAEYEKMVHGDTEIYSIKAVIAIMEDELENAEEILKDGLVFDNQSFDLNYNLAYVFEGKKEIELAVEYYKRAYSEAIDNSLKSEIEYHLNELIESLDLKIENNIVNKYIDSFCSSYEMNKKKLMELLSNLLRQRKFEEMCSICNYCIKNAKCSITELYFFNGYAYNGLKDFKRARKCHYIAIELDNKLSNIVESSKISREKYDESTTKCIGCKSEDWEIVNVSNQSISESNKGIINPIRTWVKCKKCGLIYANPIPSEKNLNKYYSIIAKEKFGGIYGDIKDREAFLFRMSNDRLDTISKYSDEKDLLDIGTGVGIFVKAAIDRKWDAKGLELTPEDCKYAKENYGLDLIQKNFYSFEENEQFDIVTMFEVIEHLRNPQKDLIRISQLVKNEGLFVLATPILDSDYGDETKELNAFWNVVSHLSYFTTNVLVDYLKNADFEVLEIKTSMEQMGRMEFYCRKISK